MKYFKRLNLISILCSIIGLIFAIFGLIVGLGSIGTEGLGKIGVVFIFPSFISIIIILVDFLITLNKIKRGLIYSWISSIIKIGIIGCFIPNAIYEYKYELKYGVSNFSFDVIVITLLIIVTFPSMLNIIKMIRLKNKVQ